MALMRIAAEALWASSDKKPKAKSLKLKARVVKFYHLPLAFGF